MFGDMQAKHRQMGLAQGQDNSLTLYASKVITTIVS